MKLERRFLILLCFLVAAGLLPFAGAAQADQVAIGFVSYDAYVPGLNSFSIFNLTGPESLSPDFSVVTSLSLLSATLTLAGSSAPGGPISLGTIAPGSLLDGTGNPLTELRFDSGSVFTSAVLQGKLSVTKIVLADGSVLQLDPSVFFTLSPSGGAALEAGTDVGVLFANTASSEVPEPNNFILVLSGLVAVLAFRLRMFVKSRIDRDGRPLQFSSK